MEKGRREDVLEAYPCFLAIPPEDWAQAEMLSLPPSTLHPIREGHRFQHALFVVEGRIRIYRTTAEGREITLYRVGRGQCCVLMMASILGDVPYEASVAIEQEVNVLLLPVPVFTNWMAAHVSLRRFIYQQFTDRMLKVTQLLESVSFQPMPVRIAAYLLHAAASGDSNAIRITHEQLAIDLGTAREVVSRTLKKMAREGALSLSRGTITIVNPGYLQEICQPQ